MLSVVSAEGTAAVVFLQSERRALRLRSARERRLIRPSLRLLPTLRLLGVATVAESESRTAPATSPASVIVSFNDSSLVKPDLKIIIKKNRIRYFNLTLIINLNILINNSEIQNI